MSRKIKIEKDRMESIIKSFIERLSGGFRSSKSIVYEAKPETTTDKATVIFEKAAWEKMSALVDEFDSEVGWHGVVERTGNPENNEYTIKDILVYPQTVSGATVTTDQEEYQNWLMSFDDDTFEKIKMQGHSHVNMSVSPSSVDNAFYDGIIDQMTGDMFYIFMIWNKKGQKTIMIYDLAKNTFFDTPDVTVEVVDEYGITEFMDQAKEVVKKPAPANVVTATAAASGGFCSDKKYGGGYSGCSWYDDYDSYWSAIK